MCVPLKSLEIYFRYCLCNISAARTLFLGKFPVNKSMFYYALLLIFKLFLNSTVILSKILIIALKRLVILGEFNKINWDYPHCTLIPLSIIKIFWNIPQITMSNLTNRFLTIEANYFHSQRFHISQHWFITHSKLRSEERRRGDVRFLAPGIESTEVYNNILLCLFCDSLTLDKFLCI